MPSISRNDSFDIDSLQPTLLESIHREMGKALVGQQDMVEQMLITVVCEQHALVEGVAGLGKWLAVQSLAQCFGLDARKLRGSPDLDLQDVIGTSSPNAAGETGLTASGPIFGNLILIDRIDRLSPKVRNVIQQAMQERVLRNGHYKMPDPFVVFATRYPTVEPGSGKSHIHDDRFLFKIDVPYPAYHEEYAATEATTQLRRDAIRQVLTSEELKQLKHAVLSCEVPAGVIHYAIRIVRATRVHEGENLDFVYEWVERGAGPRGASGLVLAAKARAILRGRKTASHDDVRAVAHPTLRHRIATNRNAQSNGITVDRVIDKLLEDIPQRIVGDDLPPRLGESFTFHNWTPIE